MDEELQSGLPAFEEAEADELDSDFDTEEEERLFKEIRDFFVAFTKTVRTAQLYVEGNPLLHQFVQDIQSRMAELWDRMPVLNFTIFEGEIRWQGHPVYAAEIGNQENLAFQLYRDGIRRLEFNPGAETEELLEFIEVLRLAKTLKDDEDDLLTLMWNRDFQYIRYEYVDVLGDEPPIPRADLSEEAGTELPALPELELSPELQTPQLREDFEPSLYFLDEADVSHLQQDLAREWNRPVKQDVSKALLDQFEMGDRDRRYEIMEILRQMLPRVLAEGDFGDAAWMVNELHGIAEAREDPSVQESVDEIVGELSQPIVIEQLVRIMEDGIVEPGNDDLATLLNALRPEAIMILIQAIPTIARQEARKQLLSTLDRLAGQKPAIMHQLVSSEDPRVASEAAKIAGRLGIVEAVDGIAGLLERPEPEVRLSAVQALVGLHSSRAGTALLRALDDDRREVRVAAAKGLAALKYKPGADELERHVKDKDLWKRDLTEQLAFFEAFAQTTGPDGVRFLDRILNGRRFLWFRYPDQLRACAARALGLLGGKDAADALAKAERIKEPMIRSAVHAAQREPEQEPAKEGSDAGQ